ncbi:MAG: septum formation initiator family protein [Alphaproteobacteria bacterium]|nr:septum formation initiator family protein [Alphaproteobacteria bacterium]
MRRHAAPALGVCALVYFSYHAIQGDRGILAWMRLSREIESARAALDVTLAEQHKLEAQVRLLRPDSLDPDMLDEQAKIVLGYGLPDEVIVGADSATAP